MEFFSYLCIKKKRTAMKTEIELQRTIHDILHTYKGVENTLVNIEGGDAIVFAPQLHRQHLKFAAKKILDTLPEIRWVYFTHDDVTHVYTRRSLEWAGFKMKQVA